METLYSLSEVRNTEIRFRWQMLGITSEWSPIYPHVVAFVESQGMFPCLLVVQLVYEELTLMRLIAQGE